MLDKFYKKVLAIMAIVLVIWDLLVITVIPTIKTVITKLVPAFQKTWSRIVEIWNG